ncbi:MAG: hypothetical protein JW715_17225 [Sedimentisphaerales bacterium]|nr:hypothetical protein [Sedimentisphaerales bacterium]
MKRQIVIIAVLSLIISRICPAKTPQADDEAKPASTNIVGQEYPKINSEGRAIFRIYAPDARSVRVGLGNTELTKDEEGFWTGITGPLDPGFHYYQIIIDGVAVADPASESFFGAGKVMSGIEIPEKGVDFYDIKNVPHGEIRMRWYFSKSTNTMRQAYVYTPPDYEKSPNTRYPVLYLQHGMGEDRRAWPTQGRTNFILDNLIAEGKARPMIVVMDDGGIAAGFGSRRGGNRGRGAGNRGRMRGESAGNPSPSADSQDEGRRQSGQRGGLSGPRGGFWDAFGSVLIEDIIPMIDSTYRTIPDREHRAMAGLSLGGTQTYSITQANLDKFAYIGIFSAPFGFPGVETGYNGLLARPEEFAEQVKVFYISMGSKEGANTGRSIHETLEQAGVRHVYYEAPGTGHEFQTWRKSLHGFAQLIFMD